MSGGDSPGGRRHDGGREPWIPSPRSPAVADQAPSGAGDEGLVRRAGAAFVWGQLAKLGEVAFLTGIGVIAVRALQPDGFGRYALLTNLVVVVSMLIPFATVEGLGAIIPRFSDRRERLSLLLLLGGLRLALVVLAFAALLVGWEEVRDLIGLGDVTLRLLLFTGCYWVALDVAGTLGGYFLANLDGRPVALWRSLGLAIALAGMVAVALLDRTTVGTVLLLVALGHGLAVLGLAGRILRSRPRRVSREQSAGVLRVTTGIWAAGLLGAVVTTQVGVLLIGAITNNPREVAFFAAAIAVIGRAQVLVFAGWSASVLPALGEALVQAGMNGFVRAWDVAAKTWILLSLPLNALILGLGPPLVEIVFGPAYAPTGGFLVWIAVFAMLTTLAGGTLGSAALWALHRQKLVVRVRLVVSPLYLVLAIVLIDRFQALGAILASGFALLAMGAAEYRFARREAPVRIPYGFAVRVLAASLVAVAAALVVRPDDPGSLLLAAGAGVAALVAALLVLRPFSRGDLEVLARLSPRLARSPLRRLAR